MTLRAGHYRAIQLFYDDGTPVLGPGGREVWVTRCGAELLGTRTDGGDATKNIATFLGIRRKTVAPSGPLTPVTVPGGVGTPGSGFEPGQGQIQGDGEGGLLTVGGGKLIVPEDKEVWVVKPCTRTPGPPPGPFPLGNHVATPLGVEYDDGSGPKAVYADGCVECEVPGVPIPCCPGLSWPRNLRCEFFGTLACPPETRPFIYNDASAAWEAVFANGLPVSMFFSNDPTHCLNISIGFAEPCLRVAAFIPCSINLVSGIVLGFNDWYDGVCTCADASEFIEIRVFQ